METNDKLQPSTPMLPHSRLGIAGFITGMLVLCILASYLGVLFTAIGSVDSNPSLYGALPRIIVYVLCSTSILSLITLVLSAIPLFQKEYKKLFAILGLAAWIAGVILIIVCYFTIFVFAS